MKRMENLKERIEIERRKLDSLLSEGNLEATYRQSLLVDRLIEEYLDMTGF